MITAESDVPAWLVERVRAWAGRLGLDALEVRVCMVRVIDGNEDIQARCSQYGQLNRADLAFLLDAKDDREWEEYIVHELLHAAHMTLDDHVTNVVIPRLKGGARRMADTLYTKTCESFVHGLAVALVRAWHEEAGTAPADPA